MVSGRMIEFLQGVEDIKLQWGEALENISCYPIGYHHIQLSSMEHPFGDARSVRSLFPVYQRVR